MTLPPPIRYSPTQHKYLLEQAADLHIACVLEDGTLATFLPHRNPESNALEFDRQKVQDYWAAYGTDVDNGSREIILQFSDENETEVIGVVSLGWAYSETGPFRGNIHKLFTSPQHRFKGVGKRLMMKVEEVARERGKTLLMLDTTIGFGAEHFYPKVGYKEVGIVPRFGIDPWTGKLRDEIWFYKDLRDEAAQNEA